MSDLISFVQSTTSPQTSAANSSATLTENFDTFLTLLTAQMQNQDPLEPTDATEFTNQLVQFSGVEQQIQTNDNLESILAANNSSVGAALSGYLGQTVELESSGAGLHDESINWNYIIGADATEAKLTISDKDGNIVYSTSANTKAGSHAFTWDGLKTNGKPAAKDEVYYADILASDENGDPVTTITRVVTTVTGIDLSYDTPALTTKAGIYSYEDLLRLTPKATS